VGSKKTVGVGCKPNFVPALSHAWATIPLGPPLPTGSSSLPVYRGASAPIGRTGLRTRLFRGVSRHTVWPCTRWGLPCLICRQISGALLPHLFTLTPSLPARGGIFSVALSRIASPTVTGFRPACRRRRVGVTHHRVLSCSDFPLAEVRTSTSDRLTHTDRRALYPPSSPPPNQPRLFGPIRTARPSRFHTTLGVKSLVFGPFSGGTVFERLRAPRRAERKLSRRG